MSESDNKTSEAVMPLRPSLFSGVPPFINYIPASGLHFGGHSLACGPQYWDEDQNWDQDQLWRYAVAMENWIEDYAKECEKNNHNGQAAKWEGANKFISAVGSNKLESKSKRLQKRFEIRPAFNQRADDAKRFVDWHPGVKLCQFPRMHQISKKDLLGKNFAEMKLKFGDEAFGFHPVTYVLPNDRSKLTKHMKREKSDCLWIVKPPHTNNGAGVYVINDPQEIPNVPVCVQQYIRNPLLLNGFKFDIRVYVLLTSMDPMRLYLFDDGLVRIATEQYTEDPDKISDCCIHVCNYAVNKLNTEKFVYNTEPDSCKGNKWRLKCLWPYLMEHCGLSKTDIENIWSEIEDVVVKTVLSAHKETRREFMDLADQTSYNSYRLIGYDLLIDANLKVHLIEVNSKPELGGAILDKSVNRPMLYEMLRIIGYHIPATMDKYQELIVKSFNLPPITKSSPVTFESGLYRRRTGIEDAYKQDKYPDTDFERKSYLDTILDDLAPGDLRQLVKSEEERNQTKLFRRLVPSEKSHKYLQYMDRLSYYDKLLDAFEYKYVDQKEVGIQRLRSLCDSNRLI